MSPSRRDVVQALLSSLLVGCANGEDDEGSGDSGMPETCPTGLDGLAFDGEMPIVGEGDRPLETSTGDGLDRRFVVDLSTLDESTLLLPPERFYVRTGEPLGLDPTNWSIDVSGLAPATTLALADLLADVEDVGAVYLECSGNSSYGGFGLMSAARFAGVPLGPLLDSLSPNTNATAVRVEGLDDHPATSGSVEGASWVYRLEELRQGWLVTEMDGEPLRADHGAPVRLLVPQWWGCACIKWVNALVFVDDSEPATSQMREFAARTHQSGSPALAADYIPAARDPAAVPVRVERWADGTTTRYRIIGLYWGPEVPDDSWEIQIGDGAWLPLTFCLPRTSQNTWGLWEAVVDVPSGEHTIALRTSADVQTRRLDSGYYVRTAQFA